MTFSISIDTLTLIVSGILLLMALVTPLLSPHFRRLRHDAPQSAIDQPHVTVLLVSNGDHVALDEHLPIYLTQDYAPGYDVVVVSEKADAETDNVLKRYANNERLYSTFVPESSRYMSKNKLAITLGVKAAKNDWIVLTDPRCKPMGSDWLSSLSQSLADHDSIVLGYVNYSEESKPYHRFEQMHTALYLLRAAQNGNAYRTNCPLLAFKKSEFMESNGFQEHLRYSIGEYDFLVNKYAKLGEHGITVSPDAWLTENAISEKTWQNRQVYHEETKKHLEGGLGLRTQFLTDQTMLHLNYIVVLAVMVFAALTSRWILLGVSVAALVLSLMLRIVNGKRALQAMGVSIPSWKNGASPNIRRKEIRRKSCGILLPTNIKNGSATWSLSPRSARAGGTLKKHVRTKPTAKKSAAYKRGLESSLCRLFFVKANDSPIFQPLFQPCQKYASADRDDAENVNTQIDQPTVL